MRHILFRNQRYDIDIVSKKRTLIHLPVVLDEEPLGVDDTVMLVPARNVMGAFATITLVRLVSICDLSQDDLRKLNADNADEYLARWDVLHPGEPSHRNSKVWRVEFRYGHSDKPHPEWCLAA